MAMIDTATQQELTDIRGIIESAIAPITIDAIRNYSIVEGDIVGTYRIDQDLYRFIISGDEFASEPIGGADEPKQDSVDFEPIQVRSDATGKSKECPGGYRIPLNWNCRGSVDESRKERIGSLEKAINRKVDEFAKSDERRTRVRFEANDGESIADFQLRRGTRTLDGKKVPTIEIPIIDFHEKIRGFGLADSVLEHIQKAFPDHAIYIELVQTRWAKKLESQGWSVERNEDDPHERNLYRMPKRSDSLRPSCIDCIVKHISSFFVLADEADRAGYPSHKLLAVGHLAEGEAESAEKYPWLSEKLRDMRKNYQATGEIPDFEEVYQWLKSAGWDLESDINKDASDKVAKVMHEFKAGKLKSSSGKKVKNRKQAIALPKAQKKDSQECGNSYISDNHVCRLGKGESSQKNLYQKLTGKALLSVAQNIEEILLDPEEPFNLGYDEIKKITKSLESKESFKRYFTAQVKNGSVLDDVANNYFSDKPRADFDRINQEIRKRALSPSLDVLEVYKQVNPLTSLAKQALSILKEYDNSREIDAALKQYPVPRKISRIAPSWVADLEDGDPRKERWMQEDRSHANYQLQKTAIADINAKWISKHQKNIDEYRQQQKQDAFPTYKKRVELQPGIVAGITHRPMDRRHGTLMSAHYGLILGTYGQAQDGKSHDIYLGNSPKSTSLFKITQTTPEGNFDEHKYIAHCRDKAEARTLFLRHAGRDRFGLIENADWEEIRPKKSERVDAETDPYPVPDDAEDVEIPESDEILADWEESIDKPYTGILDAKDADDPTLRASLAAAILLTEWLFSGQKGVYYKPATKAQPKREELTAPELSQVLEDRIDVAKAQLDRINQRYSSGELFEDEWFDLAWFEVEQLHSQAFMLGRGGVGRLSEGDRDVLRQILRFQRFKLSDFQSALMLEGGMSEAQIKNRLRMYANSARNTFKAGLHQWALSAGKTEAYRSLSPLVKEHCRQCPGYATGGFVPINQIVLPGTACDCSSQCQCSVEYR